MAALGREQLRAAVLRYVELPGARLLRAVGLTPNAVTLLGFALTVAGAGLVAANGPLGGRGMLAGGIVFLLGGGLDLMDGALARLNGSASPFGALLDSVFDRLGEAALFVGLAVYALDAGFSPAYLRFFLLALLLALIFSQGVSYLRARGEGLGVFSKAGLMTRPERVVLLGLGLIVQRIEWVLVLIAVVSCFTLFQRMFTIRRELDRQVPSSP
jgi:CDP-diacylglycerol--glycerol-3-phosphate 3-phosphatidyltransferase